MQKVSSQANISNIQMKQVYIYWIRLCMNLVSTFLNSPKMRLTHRIGVVDSKGVKKQRYLFGYKRQVTLLVEFVWAPSSYGNGINDNV